MDLFETKCFPKKYDICWGDLGVIINFTSSHMVPHHMTMIPFNVSMSIIENHINYSELINMKVMEFRLVVETK